MEVSEGGDISILKKEERIKTVFIPVTSGLHTTEVSAKFK